MTMPTAFGPQTKRPEPAHILSRMEHPSHNGFELVHTYRIPAQSDLLQDHSVGVAALQAACEARFAVHISCDVA